MSLTELEYPNPKDQFPARILAMEERIATLERLLSSSSLYSSGNKNALINGGFDVWQRGFGAFVANAAYDADQWATWILGDTHSTVAVALTPGDIPGNEPKYFHRTNLTSVAGVGNYTLLNQKIEGVRTFAGQMVTFSFWGRASVAKSIALEIEQYFGTGGTPSATLDVSISKFNLTTAWQRFSTTFVMPSIVGKTVGSGGNDYVVVQMWLNAGSNWNARASSIGQLSAAVDLWGFQLEAGNGVTVFERRPFSVELSLCQRYFLRLGKEGVGPYELMGAGWYMSTTQSWINYFYPVTMRVAPTPSYGGSLRCTTGAVGSNAVTSIGVTGSGQHTRNQASLNVGLTGGTTMYPCALQANGDNGAYLDFSAEF